MVNLLTKFKTFMFTQSIDINGVPKTILQLSFHGQIFSFGD